MPKSLTVTGSIVLIMSLWGGLSAAEPPALEPKASPPATTEPQRSKETVAPEGDDEAHVEHGVVVESVGKGSALEKAGVQPGDVLYRWRRLSNPPANPDEVSGELESPFDWIWLATEQAPRGVTKIIGSRGQTPQTFTVTPGWWEADVQPNISPEAMTALLREGETNFPRERHREGLEQPGPTDSTSQEDSASTALEAWLYLSLGKKLAAERDWEKAADAYKSSLTLTSSYFAQATTLIAMGNMYMESSDFQEAEPAYRKALKVALESIGQSLTVAQIYNRLGDLAMRRSDFGSAHTLWQDSLHIRQRLAPESLDVASSLNNLANVSTARGDLKTAMLLHKQALEIRKRLAPKSPLMAASLNNIGRLLYLSGELESAEKLLLQTLELANAGPPFTTALMNLGTIVADRGDRQSALGFFKRAEEVEAARNPNSLELARILGNIGLLASQSGDFENAIEKLQQALTIQQRLAPSSLDTAKTLRSLGTLAMERQELESSTEFFSQSLSILKRRAPHSLDMANQLIELGRLNRRRGDINQAEHYYRQTLQIQEKLIPDSPALAATLVNLGGIAGERHDFGAAEELLHRALRISEDTGTGGLTRAASLHSLGILAKDEKKFDAALQYHKLALEIRRKLAPGSLTEAISLSSIADTLEIMGRAENAIDYRQRSVTALEAQIGRMGGPEDVKANLRAHHRSIYLKAVSLLLEHGQPEAAFDIFERYRARGFLNMLAERDLFLSNDIPAALEKSQAEIVARHNRIQNKILNLEVESDENTAKLAREMSDVLREYDQVIAVIRKTAPRFATLKYPAPLTVPEIRTSLEAGTTVISFAVGTKQVYAFALQEGKPIRTARIPISETDLRSEVNKLRELISEAQGISGIKNIRLSQLQVVSRRLFEALIRPFDREIDESQRILIIPDGPLHLLPWSMLIRMETSASVIGLDWKYSTQWKPIHTALSATVYVEIGNLQRASPQTEEISQAINFVGFGDPTYPQAFRTDNLANIIDPRIRSVASRGFGFEDLPFARSEIERITTLFPKNSRAYIGTEATEKTAKSLPRNTRIAHFATHATLDAHLPLNSAVVLSIPEKFEEGKDNGLLQAWEIFEKVRIDADLVVLSACESGLGKELGGEGLIGLTRAFQYAGARTVLASLWRVNDQATSELMIRFYKHLRAGLPKDRALQAAQRELIAGPIEVTNEKGEKVLKDFSSPYYWAGFQLYGDWQ